MKPVARKLLGVAIMRLASLVPLLALLAPLALAQTARADDAPPPPPHIDGEGSPIAAPPVPPPFASSTAPAPASVATPASWRSAYQSARDQMLAGDFGAAANAFDLLAKSAVNDADRALALEDGGLCREWEGRGLVLIKRSDLGESTMASKAANRRTSDEISILYTNAVFYGIGTGAWAVAVADPSHPDAATVILPLLGFGGAAAVGVAIVDSGDHPLHYGVAQSIVTGMYVGLEEGITWTVWNQARAQHFTEWSSKTVATLIWGSTTIGAVLGGVIGSVNGTTPGRASYVGSTALWGGLVTGLLAAAISRNDHDQRDDNGLLLGALGVNAGALVGMLTARDVSPSVARVRFIDLGALAGGLVAGGLWLATGPKSDDDSTRTGLAVTGLGVAAGLTTAWFATARMPEDRLEDAKDAKPGAVALTPQLTPVRGGMVAGLGAIF